ncbi:hypothetical protein JCM8547_005779 [Rhodosporidiobolus lusitaniae]
MAPLPALPSSFAQITLRERPRAAIDPSLNSGTGTFTYEKEVKMWDLKEDVKAGEAIVRTEWVSIDPAMRGWLNPTRSYVPPVGIGEVMRAGGVGRIAYLPPSSSSSTSSSSSSNRTPTVENGNEKSAPLQAVRKPREELKVGDWVSFMSGWAEYAKVPVKELKKIEVDETISPTYYLGALGMTGQTAYWGLFDVAKIQPGETVVVSGAAGAVGSLACQLAKLHGCKVIAIAGGKEKCTWLREELGVDEVLDYKKEWKEFAKEFKEKVGYLDAYFDNVGGNLLDLALTRLKKGARIALCGAISAYNDPSPKGLQAYLNLISQRAKIEGFIVFDYASRYHEAEEQLIAHLRARRLKLRETRVTQSGLAGAPGALVGIFEGKNTGKLIVKVGRDGARL